MLVKKPVLSLQLDVERKNNRLMGWILSSQDWLRSAGLGAEYTGNQARVKSSLV